VDIVIGSKCHSENMDGSNYLFCRISIELNLKIFE
jgi:hypothetical protein